MAGLGLPELSPRRGNQLSPEEEEALRLMQEEPASAVMGDLRSDGDPDWFANGAAVRLHSLARAAHLNGQVGEVVGFDDGALRYRVLLASDETVKVVAKKNLRLLAEDEVFEDSAPAALVLEAQPTVAAASGGAAGGAPAPSPPATFSGAAPGSGLILGPPAATTAIVPAEQSRATTSILPSRDTVLRSIATVQRTIVELEVRCEARREAAAAGGPPPDEDLSDFYLRLHAAMETYTEVQEIYAGTFQMDEELARLGNQATERFEECTDAYQAIRTWREYAQDEWNVTRHNIQRHGVIGALKNDLVEVKNDVVEMARDAPEMARASSQAAARVPVLVRSATATVGDAVRGRSVSVSNAVGNAIEAQVTAPVRRVWSLLVMAFVMCFIIPLFALRIYSPMNSVVSNLGLVYAAVVIVCPPKWATRRRCKGFLLVMWPLVLVVVPLALHYWLMHPGGNRRAGASPAIPWSPQQLDQSGGGGDVAPAADSSAAFPSPGDAGVDTTLMPPLSTERLVGDGHGSFGSSIVNAVRNFALGGRGRMTPASGSPATFLARPRVTPRGMRRTATAARRASAAVAATASAAPPQRALAAGDGPRRWEV